MSVGLGQPRVQLATTTSTNDLAKAAAREGAVHGSTWVTEAQTAGRGRRGNAWISPPGDGLLFSVLLRIPSVPSRVPLLALVAGLAVRDAVARAAPGVPVGIKWPNDVLVGGRKLAGVLVEAITVGARVDAVVVGIGVNVHTRAFPEELAQRATSVALVQEQAQRRGQGQNQGQNQGRGQGTPLERDAILADILASLDRDAPLVLARGLGVLRARLEQADVLRGRRVRSDVGEPPDEGVAAGIDDDGRLLVRRDDGVQTRWSAGEVHLILE